jgi:thiamine-phosphate pyrophosphorylase
LLPGLNPIFCYVTDRKALAEARASFISLTGLPASEVTQFLGGCIHRVARQGWEHKWIQIREKDMEGRALVELARFTVKEASAASARVLINDRLDVALAANAAGVHLGEESLPVEVVAAWRREAGRPDFMIGVSTHSLEAARAAERGGADYVFFGPVFATPSKAEYGAPQGIERLREVCAAVAIPVLAIGGVTYENMFACLEAGAAGVAAIKWFQSLGTAVP